MLRAVILAASIFSSARADFERCFYATPTEDSTGRFKVCIQPDGGARTYAVPGLAPATTPKPRSRALLQEGDDALAKDLDEVYLLVMGTLVFLMQAGFALVEAGSVSTKNVQNILYKNFMDVLLGAISFWLVGYGLAYGDHVDGGNWFIGVNNFALSEFTNEEHSYGMFFFQFVFAATAATIVSGAVAERCCLGAYFVYSAVVSAWIYPVVVHWGWSGTGWLSAFAPVEVRLFGKNGMIDFAGSGIVHMVGGWAAVVAAWMIGPRRGRFNEDGTPNDLQGHSMTLTALGVFILFFGWYGFNPGSTLMASGGASGIATKVAVVTTISAAAGGIMCTFLSHVIKKKFDLTWTLNGVLAGLVSITAPCAVVDPVQAFFIGLIGAIVYAFASKLLLKLRIDDPVDAGPVHGFCGLWAVLSVGIFGTRENIKYSYGFDNDAMATGEQFATQAIAAVSILAWTVINCLVLFFVIKKTIGLRVSQLEEVLGLDRLEHGNSAYTNVSEDSSKDLVASVLQSAIDTIIRTTMSPGDPLISRPILNEAQLRALKDVFMLFDVAGTGQVPVADMRKKLQKMNLGLTNDQVDGIVASLDSDGSGSVDFEEFKALVIGVARKRKNSSVNIHLNN